MTAPTLHHVAIVVRDIDAALPFWREQLGLEMRVVRDVPAQRVRVALLAAGDGLVELIQPLDGESGVARYLAGLERDAGLHHLCLAVDDLRAELGRLERQGVELVDRVPRPGAEGDVAFLHPRAAGGVLVELTEK